MTEDVIMANEVILDVTEGIRALATDVVNLVKEASFDTQTGFSAGALNGL